MKQILLFGAGKSATILIDYLIKEGKVNNWFLTVCDVDLEMLSNKLGGNENTKASAIDVKNDQEREQLIQNADVVISLLPAYLHFLVAKDCLKYSKHLLTASYMDSNIKSLEKDVKQKDILFLCEMGLDPGIDHMSAMKLLNSIRKDKGVIKSFISHCGGLVAPESDTNPWHYKITWNAYNVIVAGAEGAEYLKDGNITKVPYSSVFRNAPAVKVAGLPDLAWYPNRNSLQYIDTYSLSGIDTFIRTTLRHPAFIRGWSKLINIGFTQTGDFEKIKNCKTYRDWFQIKTARYTAVEKDWNNYLHLYITDPYKDEFAKQIGFLKLDSKDLLPENFTCSADILQSILEKKFKLEESDHDMVVMQHEIIYLIDNKSYSVTSSLITMGEDVRRTAMAKTVGLPLGIATKLLLQEKLTLRGLTIPIHSEIIDQVLPELELHGIAFEDTISEL